jgi:mono/diheme cytochrome c family protein
LDLTEAEFIESMRTGKDFHDSTDDAPQRMLFMPIQAYRFILEEDLKAIYAFLQSIPPVHNELRLEYVPNFPFPPVALPLLDEGADPEGITRGLQIPHAFSSGPETDAFTDQFDTNVGNLSDGERAKVGRGAYLVNAIANCNTCHTDGVPDGAADSGLVPDTFDFNAATHLAGGVDLAGRNRLPFPVLSRNLTSHPDTGLEITEAEFVQVMRFGADFRRPGGSLRVGPHFLAGFRMTFVDLQAIYAYLRTIPAVDNEITITEPE